MPAMTPARRKLTGRSVAGQAQHFADQRENASADSDADAVKDEQWQGQYPAQLVPAMAAV